MITARYVRENIDAIRKSLDKRKSTYPIDELLALDEEYRKLQKEAQVLREKRNKGSKEVSDARKEGRDADSKIEELSVIKQRLEEIETKMPTYEERISYYLLNMPNVLDDSVPYGKDENENKVVKSVGRSEAKEMPTHEETLLALDLLDLEQAAKVSGARFYYLKGDLALLEQALIRFAIDEMVKKGYMLIAPPLMLRNEFYRGVTAIGDFEESLYKVEDPTEVEEGNDLERMKDELFLIATSEHAIAALNAEKVFSGKELPKRYVGVSPCFRREAGSHGKDSKGIFRVHQFYKVEQFIVSKPQDSWRMFDELIKNTEQLFEKLGIPYRIVNICTGDIGIVAAKKFDLEAFMPGQGKYREMASCSNCTDWQALRLDIKYDEAGERKYVHTLNSTAIATTRTLVAIVENYRNQDGTVKIPDVLVPYMNGKSRLG